MTDPVESPSLEILPEGGSDVAPIAEAWPSPSVLALRSAKLSGIVLGLGLLLLSRIPVCPMANLTGIPCPGCGLTRATLSCVKGHFADAFHLQPLVFFATPMVGLCAVLATHSYLKRGRVKFSDRVGRLVMPPLKVLYAALVVLWVVRFFGVSGGPVPVEPSLFARFFG